MKTLFTNAQIIDGTGETFRGFLAIDGNEISKVGPGAPDDTPSGFEVVDLAGACLLPGFFDCHVHLRSDGLADPRAQVLSDTDAMCALRSARNAQQTIEAGITTIRDCGSTNFVDFSVRKAVENGLIPGPRMMLSGKIICMTGGHGWNVGHQADGPDGVRRAAREQLRAGADNVKLAATGGILTPGTEIGASQFTVDELRAAVEEAKKRGATSCAHAHGASGIKNAVEAGVDSIEHGYYLDEEGIEMMLARGTVLVATSAAVRNVAAKGVEHGLLEDVHRKASEAVESHIETFTQAYKAGVKLAMGTDSGVPFTHHGNNLDELGYLVEMGLSPMEAIQAATLESAKLLQLGDSLGSLQAGKLADVVVFDGDPLADISGLRDRQRIKWVIKDGEAVVRRDETGRNLGTSSQSLQMRAS
ncbi:MAG: amidohydrolase family protein [Pseudomonadota bacterium]|nr:amidohydrolase family protein [Pseudomonadota bacterium]